MWKTLSLTALLVCVAFSPSVAAKLEQGKLFVEINLAASTELQLTPKSALGSIRITELDGLMNREFKGGISISLVNPEAVAYYGILDHRSTEEPSNEDTLAVPNEFFDWADRKLFIRKEWLYFLPQSFSERSAAEFFASKEGISSKRIMEVNMINSTVMVKSLKGEKIYLETPLIIHSAALKIGGNSLVYDGTFILKTIHRKLVLNHYLPLEDYLAVVIQNEIGNKSPLEALKAQAVAARTHAISLLLNNRHKPDGYDLCSGTHCQVYKGRYQHNDLIGQAVRETSNEVLMIGDAVADATYHSSCGGKTDSSAAIWRGKTLAHLSGVTCIPEADSLDFTNEQVVRKWLNTQTDTSGMLSWEQGTMNWEATISTKQVAANTGIKNLSRIEILERGRSGRIVSMKLVGDKTVKLDNEYKIRQAFSNLLSSFFYIKGGYTSSKGITIVHPKDTIHIRGRGAGHGVGMCQVGALRMGRSGRGYTEILSLYYPGTTINKEWLSE